MESLEWLNFQQIRWQGEYEVLQISDTSFQCQLVHYKMELVGEQIEIAYLAEKGFMLQAKTIAKMAMVRL